MLLWPMLQSAHKVDPWAPEAQRKSPTCKSSTVYGSSINYQSLTETERSTNEPKPKLPPRSVENPENFKRILSQARDDLATLRSKAKTDLETKDQELQQANVGLQKLEQERDELYKRWKQATSELNKVLVQSQGFHQVTDQELIQKTTQLRYNIRNFADEQQFVTEARDVKGGRSFRTSAKEYLGISPDILENLLRVRSKHAMVIKAYLWAVVAKDIFGKFCWAGTRGSHSMSYLMDVLSKSSLYGYIT